MPDKESRGFYFLRGGFDAISTGSGRKSTGRLSTARAGCSAGFLFFSCHLLLDSGHKLDCKQPCPSPHVSSFPSMNIIFQFHPVPPYSAIQDCVVGPYHQILGPPLSTPVILLHHFSAYSWYVPGSGSSESSNSRSTGRWGCHS